MNAANVATRYLRGERIEEWRLIQACKRFSAVAFGISRRRRHRGWAQWIQRQYELLKEKEREREAA